MVRLSRKGGTRVSLAGPLGPVDTGVLSRLAFDGHASDFDDQIETCEIGHTKLLWLSTAHMRDGPAADHGPG